MTGKDFKKLENTKPTSVNERGGIHEVSAKPKTLV